MSNEMRLLQALLLMILALILKTSAMEWCEYFEAFGEYRPECARDREVLQVNPTNSESDETLDPGQEEFERTAIIRLIKHSGGDTKNSLQELIQKLEPKTCAPHRYYMCVENELCSTGKICMQSNGMSCCEPPVNHCPSVETLEISCTVPNPINWCNTDADCHSTPTRRCCPSGCNYNTCI